MPKKNVSLIVGLVIVIVLIGGVYAITRKATKTTPAISSSTTSSTPSTTPSTSSGSIIQTKTNAKVGQYLADASGNALYTYGADTAGVSNCSGSCLYSWPMYAVTTSSASLPTNITVIKRSDGSSQYAYKDLPLYTFSADSAGQVTGDGVSKFHIAKP